jgi:hypothetical protein
MSDGATLGERLNNAIVKLQFNTPDTPKGVKKAINELADHWIAWWDSAERKMLPPALLGGKLERYAAWYARGWSLVPPEVRAKAPNPRELDATVYAIVEDQLKYMAEGAQAAAETGKDVALFLKEQARALRDEMLEQATTALGGVAILAVLAIGLLLAFGWQKGR